MKRVLTSIVAIPILVYIILFAPVWVCTGIIFLAMLLALHEYFGLTNPSRAFRVAGAVIAAAACLMPVWSEGVIVLWIGPMLILGVCVFSGEEIRKSFRSAVFSFFGAAYVGGLMGFMIAIRLWSNGYLSGAELLLMLFIVIWSGDSFAYFAGKSFGRHKLAPVISPHKTWEGAVAGFLFSIVAAVVCKYTFLQEMNLSDAVALGALIGVIGQIGDLAESIVKRAAEVKDSGGIIPGHGGMLDRIDSLLFGAPAMYYYLSFLVT